MTLTLRTPTQETDKDAAAPDEDFALNLRLPEAPAERERMAVLLYALRAVSQGNAARIAGLTRAAVFDALGRPRGTPFQYDDADELRADLDTLAEARAHAEAQANDPQAARP